MLHQLLPQENTIRYTMNNNDINALGPVSIVSFIVPVCEILYFYAEQSDECFPAPKSQHAR